MIEVVENMKCIGYFKSNFSVYSVLRYLVIAEVVNKLDLKEFILAPNVPKFG